MADPVKQVDPPVTVPPLISIASGEQQFSQAWTEHNQNIADQVNKLLVNMGITDGSDAAAGQVGEYLTASGAGVGLANNVLVTVATLNLTAGDWDVSGGVTFHLTGVTATAYGAGIDALGQLIVGNATTTASGLWLLSAGAPVRRNVTAATAVNLVARAGFSAGTIAADGVVQARRVR
jgi:hypothetical protein